MNYDKRAPNWKQNSCTYLHIWHLSWRQSITFGWSIIMDVSIYPLGKDFEWRNSVINDYFSSSQVFFDDGRRKNKAMSMNTDFCILINYDIIETFGKAYNELFDQPWIKRTNIDHSLQDMCIVQHLHDFIPYFSFFI